MPDLYRQSNGGELREHAESSSAGLAVGCGVSDQKRKNGARRTGVRLMLCSWNPGQILGHA